MQRTDSIPSAAESGTPAVFRVEVFPRPDQPHDNVWLDTAHQLGISGFTACRAGRLYFLQGSLSAADADLLAHDLLADPVTEVYVINHNFAPEHIAHSIDVTLLPGVTDPAAENLLRAAHLLGIHGLERAATGQRYLLAGVLSASQLEQLAAEVFSNPVIQRHSVDTAIVPPFIPYRAADDTVDTVTLRDASDDGLLTISAERRLSLDLAEMQAIQAYFRREGRDPTDAELEMLAQTWSEHCVHKTFKALIDYTGPEGAVTVDGLLKTYIRAATDRVNRPWVRSAFVDNAGVIAFDQHHDLAFKVETHNRPSAIEPFGGANTGIGGVIRDVLGVSARPIANTDILCFGPPDLPHEALQPGVLHPRRIAAGVVAGIEDYGNKMGIPTVNGAILYHPGYTANPLVFCGCLGIVPCGAHRTTARPGDLIIVIGGRTGRDGLRGATFSSMEIDQTTGTVSGGAVQIGHPIHEKQVMEAVLRACDEGLYNAITDCGAGGLSSAVGEMGQRLGASVQLADVPLKYPGLRPWEIWLSEAQERMVLAVTPDNWPRLQAICDGQDIEAVCIGVFEDTGRLRLRYGDTFVGDITMDFLHDGIPRRRLSAVWQPAAATAWQAPQAENLNDTLLRLLAHPNIRSKEAVIRRYDHEVQGGTAVKPLVGHGDGPGDAAVIVPALTRTPSPAEWGKARAVAISNGVCPAYGEIDPYAMAWAAVDEALRNLVAVGADPDQAALLDNFCWGNASLPDRLGALVRCAQGCYDAAVAFNAPFVSGKDSLNNEYLGADGQRHAIPGTLVISAIGIVPDAYKTITMDLKAAGDALYIVGETRPELGGSHYNLIHGISGGTVPQPVSGALGTMRALHRAIQAGLVRACHDVSEGGIAVTLAEMCLAGQLGAATVAMPSVEALFSESLARFIVEVRPADQAAFEGLLHEAGAPVQMLGAVSERGHLHIPCDTGAVDLPVTALERAWRGESEPVEPPPMPPLANAQPVGHAPTVRTQSPRVLILHATGTNRDHDAALACELAGGAPEIVHINQLVSGERRLMDYQMLVVPGGFSYGDDLGAGTLWALDLRRRFDSEIARFIAEGRPVLGICNGFQALVKAGLLPGDTSSDHTDSAAPPVRAVTLTHNARARFECRWVHLLPNPASPSLFTHGLTEPIYCPVAHGEGRIAFRDAQSRDDLWQRGLAPLIYVEANSSPASYPANPNGSEYNIAALCNPQGNVLGLMPHPENHIFPWQHPRFHRGEHGMTGLRLFENGIRHA